jgi:transposase
MNRQRGYQRHPRFTKRLEATFSSGGLSFRGILSNISANGLFIRTNRGFTPDTIVDIEVVMPDNRISLLKGVVKRTIKTPLTSTGNGMGIELTEKDAIYVNFVRSITDDTKKTGEEPSPPEFQILSCPACGVKNKILTSKISLGPKCGRCGTFLAADLN